MLFTKKYESINELLSSEKLTEFQRNIYSRLYQEYGKSLSIFVSENKQEYFKNVEDFINNGFILSDFGQIAELFEKYSVSDHIMKQIIETNNLSDNEVFHEILAKIDGEILFKCNESQNVIPINKKAKIAEKVLSRLPSIENSTDNEILFSLDLGSCFNVVLNFDKEFIYTYKHNQESGCFGLKEFCQRVKCAIENPMRAVVAVALIVGVSCSTSAAGEVQKTNYPHTVGYLLDLDKNLKELSKKSKSGCDYSAEFIETVDSEKFLIGEKEVRVKTGSTITAQVKLVNYTVNFKYTFSKKGIKKEVSKHLSVDKNQYEKKCGLSLRDEREFSDFIKKYLNKAISLDS